MSAQSPFRASYAPSIPSLTPQEASAKTAVADKNYAKTGKMNTMGSYFIWFVIIVLITWFVLYLWKPTWVMKKDDTGKVTSEINTGSILLWSLVIAIGITLLIWLFKSM